MRHEQTEAPTIEVRAECKCKKCQIIINGRVRHMNHATVILTLDDFIEPGKTGFGILHDRLRVTAARFKFDFDALIRHVAYASVTRVAHIARYFKLPRFIANEVVDAFVDARAGIIEQSGMKKSAAYVMYLRGIVEPIETVATIEPRSNRKYRMPSESGAEEEFGQTLDTMTAPMLQAEYDEAVLKNARRVVRERIKTYLDAAKAKDKEEQKVQQQHGNTKMQQKLKGFGGDASGLSAAIEAEMNENQSMTAKERKVLAKKARKEMAQGPQSMSKEARQRYDASMQEDRAPHAKKGGKRA